MSESDTPRTDATEHDDYGLNGTVVHADFARTLERELTAARAELAENESVINVWRGRTQRAEAELETYRDSCAAKADRIDRLGEQAVKLRAEVETLKRWRDAVIDAAVVGWTYCAADDADPRGCLSRIMAANAQIALDPTVSSEAEALIERGRQELRAEVEALHSLLPGPYYMDPPDGGDVPIVEQMRRMAKDAERYRYLRSRQAIEVLTGRGPGAGVWCDMENEMGTLVLVTGDDLDAEVDAALAKEKP
jgi:hypothetical protein